MTRAELEAELAEAVVQLAEERARRLDLEQLLDRAVALLADLSDSLGSFGEAVRERDGIAGAARWAFVVQAHNHARAFGRDLLAGRPSAHHNPTPERTDRDPRP